jgi:hypothetical protein
MSRERSRERPVVHSGGVIWSGELLLLYKVGHHSSHLRGPTGRRAAPAAGYKYHVLRRCPKKQAPPTSMLRLFRPLFLLLAQATDRQLARIVEYLKVENRLLRDQLPTRLRVTLQSVADWLSWAGRWALRFGSW